MAFLSRPFFSSRPLSLNPQLLYRTVSGRSSSVHKVESNEETEAPAMRDFYGSRRGLKTSPQKLNLVAKLIRRMKVVDALVQLEFCEKKTATYVKEVLQDTHSRAIKYHKANPDNLYVAESFVGKGTYLKRPRYHGRGRHTIMSKYYAHYFLKLREGPPPLKGKPFDKEKSSKRYATWRLIRRGPLSVPNCL